MSWATTIRSRRCDERISLRRESAVSFEVLAQPAGRRCNQYSPESKCSALWEFARTGELVIVTKDADFSDRIITSEPPPWVVHLRFGNIRRRDFHALLARVWPQVEQSLKTNKLVNVYADRIEAIG